MPTWTRPTTDTGPGADGTSGHVASADADGARSPTTDPGDAPRDPGEPTED